MDRQPAFGRRLKALRQRRGLSQTDLARGALSASAVSLLEAGRREPTRATIEALAVQLGCSAAFLADGIDTLNVADASRLVALGEVELREGRQDAAARLFENALVEGVIDPWRAMRARIGLAETAEAAGDYEKALATIEGLVAEFAKEKVVLPLAVAVPLARLQRATGRLQECQRTAADALERVDQLGLGGLQEYVQLASVVVGQLADAGDIAGAAAQAAALLKGAEPDRSRTEQAVAYQSASERAAADGCELEALHLAECAARIMRQADGMSSPAALRMSLAWLTLRAAEPDAAAAENLLLDARHELQTIGDVNTLVCCETQLSQVALAQKRPADAAQWAEAALDRVGPEVGAFEVIHARIALGESRFACGETEAAVESYTAAAAALRQFGGSTMTAMVWRELGRLFHEAGQAAEALNAYHQALGTPSH